MAAYRWAIFGDMYFYLHVDKANKVINIEAIDPSNLFFDTTDWLPTWDVKYIVRARLEDIDSVKKMYPNFKNRITASAYANSLINISDFRKSSLYSFDKTIVFYLIDKDYVYTSINGVMLVETKKHWLPFLPVYHWPYIYTGDWNGKSVVDVIYEPVKYLHLALSYILTNAYDLSTSPIIAEWASPQLADQKGRIRWLITVPRWWSVTYLQPPQSNLDLYKVIEFAKQFMHFISGISEEAMAWFTWALTSAGVAIELRMDSTVREVLDSQVVLQELLQRMNADAMKLYEKFFPNENLYQSKTYWEQNKDKKFTGAMISWNYNNIIDFGWILPRNETQTIQNVLAKKKMNLISHDTALEELRYQDPTTEIMKIKKEQVDMQRLSKAIQSWEEYKVVWFEWPKEEDLYMLTEWQPAQVLPEQNHAEHYNQHMKTYTKTKNEIILMHMMLHERLAQGGWWMPTVSKEWEQPWSEQPPQWGFPQSGQVNPAIWQITPQ